MRDITTIKWEDRKIVLLDQTLLPGRIEYITLETPEEAWHAINIMQVRGAPAIGVTAAYAMAIAARQIKADNSADFLSALQQTGDYLETARPTAVNLSWATRRMIKKASDIKDASISQVKDELEKEAISIHLEDEQINRQIGENALGLFKEGQGILTHCNAGALATTKYGTALAPFYLAKEKGMNLKVYADETRPRLQGSRLTAFELLEAGIDVTLICDNMAPVLMSQGKIDAVIVGCDRVAANGDVANKIGTLGVSIAAKYYGIPMYIAAPTPTIDMTCQSGADIPIEERAADEITCRFGVWTAPKGVNTINPAFDITPADNITAIITEKGIAYPSYKQNLQKIFTKLQKD